MRRQSAILGMNVEGRPTEGRMLRAHLQSACSKEAPFSEKLGAGDEIRTRNLDLGKVLPYHWATPACGDTAILLRKLARG